MFLSIQREKYQHWNHHPERHRSAQPLSGVIFHNNQVAPMQWQSSSGKNILSGEITVVRESNIFSLIVIGFCPSLGLMGDIFLARHSNGLSHTLPVMYEHDPFLCPRHAFLDRQFILLLDTKRTTIGCSVLLWKLLPLFHLWDVVSLVFHLTHFLSCFAWTFQPVLSLSLSLALFLHFTFSFPSTIKKQKLMNNGVQQLAALNL